MKTKTDLDAIEKALAHMDRIAADPLVDRVAAAIAGIAIGILAVARTIVEEDARLRDERGDE